MTDPAARVEALEALLVEKGLVDPTVVDQVIEHYETSVGPLNGAKVVARAWADPAYRQRLLTDGTRAIAEFGFGGPEAQKLIAVENTPTVHNVVVCTLCSCYPWPVLGLPPAWYKSTAYRSRMVAQPRALLAEMGLDLPSHVRIRVWDSSADARYLVVPERPPGTEGFDEAALSRLVTRDSMVGVGRAVNPVDV
ncbi:MAG: nitrile hydratase subunit alpha [Candidatus Sericytochromatia bacterium]